MIIYYTVPETQHVRCNFYFSFWAMFCPFTTLTAWKKKISKKWKNASGYHQFTQVYQKSWSHAILFLRYGTWQMKIFHFGLFFVLLPPPPLPQTAQKNENLIKNEKKNSWRYHHIIQIYQKSWSYAIMFLRYDVWQM